MYNSMKNNSFPKGGLKKKNAAVNKNSIVAKTVDTNENVNTAENLTFDNDAHLFSHDGLDKIKVVKSRESLTGQSDMVFLLFLITDQDSNNLQELLGVLV